MKLHHLLWAAAATAALALPRANAADEGCPDEKATEIGGFDIGSLAGQTCSLSISLFGVVGIVADKHCPTVRIHVPASAVCAGEEQVNAQCVYAGTVTATIESCHCAPLSSGGSSLSIQGTGCSCDEVGEFGTVPTYATGDC